MTHPIQTRIPTLLNGRFLLEQRPTGTHRSALGFAKALLTYPGQIDLTISTDTSRVSLEAQRQLEGAKWLHRSLKNKIRAHLWEQLTLPGDMAGAVQLYPLNTGPFLRPGKKQIVFIHDIHFLTAPDVFSRSFRLWNRLASALAAQRAGRIVCFTEFVKNDLVEHLGVSPEKIGVVPQGPGIDLDAEMVEKRDIPEKYFLCVGGLQPHKNLKTALNAFAASGLPEDGYRLVIIGRRQGNFAQLEVPEKLTNAPWLEFTGYVSDGELIAYYRRAAGLIYISLMEGFGLPIVESFHLGCPVITSNLSCLPEVAGDAALLVDPLDIPAITKAIRSLANDPALREKLVGNGKIRAQKYTWERAGNAVVSEIQRVAAFP